MNIRGINDVYGVGELEATDSALIEAHERGHDFGDWQRMRFAYGIKCKKAKYRGTMASLFWRVRAVEL